MALSKSVEESLTEAEANLRNALAFAARQERPVVCTQIAKLISDIENIGSMDSILDTLDEKIAELDDDQ
jgi:superfamily I DNA and RNA helicase